MANFSPKSFDVFLSFRGVDTCRNFVSRLYDELDRKGISTYKDDRQIERAESVSSELLHAIQQSKIAVVVLSKNYASSSWCLDELVKIMECREKRSLRVIPIFHEVDPSHVRKLTGKVGAGMKEHLEREHPEKMHRWRDALTRLGGDLAGYWLDDRKDESLLASVIDKFITTIKEMIEPLEIQSETEVGMETISRLHLHEDWKRAKHLTGLPERMASSSSSPWKFDVFLSFRGEDTRRNFVSFLYKELARKGIMAFNDEYIPIGESVSLRLQAIQESRIAVIVMSENYASSRWCLDELAAIMGCRKERSLMVIPIFYEVDPSDVRKQTGKLRGDKKKHEGREHSEKVQRWRDALTQLCNLSGYDSRNCEDEAMLIRKITNDVLEALIATSSSDLSGLVGMDTHVKALNGLLELESVGVHKIGIFGIPGIGKTSLASYIYGKISPNFDTSFFLENVKKIYEDHGGLGLREQLQLKYLQEGAETEGIPSGDSDVIRSWLRQRRVLLVVDDVDEIKQLDTVAKEASWFGARSKIIITTRKRSVLEAYGVKDVYEVRHLCHSDALQLFSYFAFKQNDPPVGFEHLSYRAVELSRGVPLALITLGSTLSIISEGKWENVLHRLGRSLAEGITETMKSSFAELDEEDKSMTSHILNLSISTTLGDSDVFIGMDHHMKEMYDLLDLKSDEVRMIGIWGMAGVGKTTLARYVYEEVSPYFTSCCFLENVGKMYRYCGPSGLQEELLLKTQGKKLSKWKSSMDSNVVKARLGGQKVLLVIDGVDDIGQLKAIAKGEDWFGRGSRVILIAEDKSLLVKHGVKHSHEVQLPRYDEALQLFCQFAFRQERPYIGFERLSTCIVQLASRLPLALKIFGSFLYGKSKEEWESTSHRLEASLKKDALEILKAMED